MSPWRRSPGTSGSSAFEQDGLVFLYQEETAEGKERSFSKLVSREAA